VFGREGSVIVDDSWAWAGDVEEAGIFDDGSLGDSWAGDVEEAGIFDDGSLGDSWAGDVEEAGIFDDGSLGDSWAWAEVVEEAGIFNDVSVEDSSFSWAGIGIELVEAVGLCKNFFLTEDVEGAGKFEETIRFVETGNECDKFVGFRGIEGVKGTASTEMSIGKGGITAGDGDEFVKQLELNESGSFSSNVLVASFIGL